MSRALRRPALVAVVGLSAVLWAGACKPRRPPPAATAPASATASAGPVPGFPTVPLLEKPTWKTYDRAQDLGVPAGCRLLLPVKSTPLPAGTVRFIAPPETTSELYVAVDADGDGIVDRSGVLDGAGAVGHALPWSKIDAPPIIVHGPAGYLALDTEDTGRGARRLMLWRELGSVEPVVEGDALEVVDARCDGTRCAVLTTLASASAGPGATLLVGEATTPPATWARTDLPAEDARWAPLSIVRMNGTDLTVAALSEKNLGVFEVHAGTVSPSTRIAAPFGAYDVVVGARPFAVAPGESLEGGCRKDGFPLHILRAGADPLVIDGQVPPVNVLTRGLSSGFLVGWLAPVSCRHDARQFVRAFLVGPDGTPRSSTMAVADATGFALSTRGDEVDLWLAIGKELVWSKARCALPAPG
ncbi:MAG TPA: hypothetical protein VHE30_13340 [Polyangiaceae bacterium]|nr:hypothetical protein [Polyangiaceae bacterium]